MTGEKTPEDHPTTGLDWTRIEEVSSEDVDDRFVDTVIDNRRRGKRDGEDSPAAPSEPPVSPPAPRG
jgi:hypothetical protein